MWYVGIDLQRASLVIAAVDDAGRASEPARVGCRDTDGILRAMDWLNLFRAAIGATSSSRWICDLLPPPARPSSLTRFGCGRWSSADDLLIRPFGTRGVP